MLDEEWRPIHGWAGYEVSSAGRIRSWKRCRRTPDEVLPRILSDYRLPAGYHYMKLKDRGASRGVGVHVLVAEAFLGPRPDGMDVAHWDGDKSNNALTNLRYATRTENAQDSIRLGSVSKGERHYMAVLTEDEALALLHFPGSHRQAAEKFGVNYHVAYCIRTRRTWPHLSTR